MPVIKSAWREYIRLIIPLQIMLKTKASKSGDYVSIGIVVVGLFHGGSFFA